MSLKVELTKVETVNGRLVYTGIICPFVPTLELHLGSKHTETTYGALGRFRYAGSDVVGVPQFIKFVAEVTAGLTSGEIRVVDLTNSSNQIGEVSLTNTSPVVVDLGTLADIPTGEAVFEVQAKRTGGTGVDYTAVDSVSVMF